MQAPTSQKAGNGLTSALSAQRAGDGIHPHRSQEEVRDSDLRKVVAFSLVILAYLFIPILILIIVILGIETLSETLAFAASGDSSDLEPALIYLVVTIALAYALRRLVRWARE